ncbi:MAG: transposase [Bacteroidota bacterium]
MSYNPAIHHRQSIRLKGHDYFEPGYYFVNICTKKKLTILGEVDNAAIKLSPLGRIVDACWKEIPKHYPLAKLDSFQIMPNHIHAIINLDEIRRDGACPVPTEGIREVPKKNSLFDVVGSFKSAATKAVHEAGHFVGRPIWQTRFYDHIIRDNISLYFIQQYIELNPLMWEYSRWNPRGKKITLEQFENILKEKFQIEGSAAAIILGSEKMFELNAI